MNVDNSYDPADSSSSDEGRMQIDESAGRSDDDTPKNIVQPPSVFETLKENDDEEVEEIEEEEEEDESGEEDDDDDEDGDEEDDDGDDDEDEEDEESEEDEEWEEYEEDVDASLPASLTVDSDIGDEDPCPICLNRLRDQDQGTPESCDHHFCLECIQEWAKNVNTCPVDRQVFRLILARRPGEDSVYKRIPIEDRNTQAEETEDELTYCEVCGRCDREDRLLLCDGCDLGYHLDCLSPPLADVPVDEWFCSDCAAANRGSTTITSEEEEEIVVRPPRRLIARTLVSERVRSLIQQTRMERARRRVIVSSSEDEAETSSKTPTPKKPPVKRRIIKRRRRKRKSVKKSTKTGVKTKRRKRKTRRKKTRKGGKRRKVRRLSARQPVVTTVKSRIAGKLGLSKPPVGLSIPLQKLPTGKTIEMQRAEIGISPFSILGHKDDLGPVYQDENVSEDRQPGTSSSCPTSSRVVKYSKSSLRSHKPVFRSKIIAASTERASNPSTTIVAPSMSSGAPFDILGSIMHGQSFLHMQSKDVTIHKDGSLIPNKEVPEAKVPESKDNVFELNTFKKNIADEDTKVGESLTSPIKPFRISKPKKPGASFKTTDRDYLAVFGIQDMDENSQEKAKESEYDPSQPTDDADALQQDDASGQSPEENVLQKNSDEPSKLPMHSDISDDDSSSEKRVVVEKDSSLMIELSCTGDSTPDSQNSLSRRQVYEDGENEVEVPMEKEAEDEKASFEDGEIVRTEEESHDSLGKWSVGSDESALEKEYQMRMHEFAQLTRKEKKVRRRMEADQVEDGEESVFDRLNFGEYDARAYRTREKNESRRKRRKEKEERKEKLSSLHDSKEISKVHEDVKSDREIYEESRCDDKEEVYVYEESEIVSEKKEKKRSKHNRLEQYVYESDSHVKHKHRREKSRSQSRSREKVRTRSHSKDRYRTRSRSREKHDSRSRSRVRHRSRSRSREKRRSHSRERRHARSHDRSRRKKRERERERSGSRERSEERERSSRKKKRDRDRDRDHERERERSRERIERKGWRSRTPSDSPSPIKHSDKDSLNKENRHYHKRKSLKLDDYNDYPVIEKVKKAKPLETTKPHFERTMKVIEHTCNCHDPIVIDDDDDEEDVVEDSVIFGSIGVNLEDIPTPPAKKDTLPPPLAKTNQPTPPKKDVASKTVEGDGKIPTIIDQKIQPSTKHDSSGKNKAKQKKIPTIVDKVASDVDVSTMVLEVDEEMHNYDPAHPTDEEIEKEILKYDQLHHHPSANLDIALPPLPRNSPNVADNRMQFSSAEAGNIPLPPGSTLPQITPLPPNPSLPAVSFNMLPRVPTSIAQRPMLGNPLLMNRPVSFQSLPTMPPQGPPPQFGWPVNSTQVMSIQNQFGPPIMSRPPVMSVMPQAMLNGGLEEIPPESDSLFARNAPINNSTNLQMNMNNSTNVPMNLNPMNQMNVGSRGHSPRPTDTRPSAHKILASTNSKESEKQALPIQQLQSISTLLKVHACLTGKNSKRDGVFKIPQPVSGSKQKSRENEDPLDSMEMIDMDLSPLDEECELVLPTPPESMGKSKRSRKSKHKSVKALVSQQDDMPSSAADLTNKEKYLKKLHLQERVVDEVKCAIKPYYSSKKITKDEYKEILRKAVPKVCHSKAGEINPMKIKSLVEAYVTKFCKNRQGGKKTKKDDSKANGMKSKASR